MLHSTSQKGFTLFELLIVIAIVALLSTVAVVVINPTELLKRGRDAQRVADLAAISNAVGLMRVDHPGAFMGDPNTIYVSLPDTSSTCVNHPTLPSLPAGWSYHCRLPADFMRIDGQGWIPINFTIIPAGSPIATLPIDPVNNAIHYYAYVTGHGWTATALLESEQFLRTRANRDGGSDPARFEVGTNFQLWARSTGLVGYWPFDGNFQDHSGLANHGTQHGGVTFAEGRQGQAGRFDGVDDRVEVPDSANLRLPNSVTAAVWINWAGPLPAHTYDWFKIYGKPNNYQLFISRGWRFAHFCSRINGIWSCADSPHNTIPINSWIHIVSVYDGARFILYLNGERVDERSLTGTMETNANAFLISPPRAVNWFNGLIDELRIYNRALTADEIRAIFEATR